MMQTLEWQLERRPAYGVMLATGRGVARRRRLDGAAGWVVEADGWAVLLAVGFADPDWPHQAREPRLSPAL